MLNPYEDETAKETSPLTPKGEECNDEYSPYCLSVRQAPIRHEKLPLNRQATSLLALTSLW